MNWWRQTESYNPILQCPACGRSTYLRRPLCPACDHIIPISKSTAALLVRLRVDE